MVRVESLTKEYSSGRGRVLALQDVSLAVEKGEAAAVFGKSGSGKTTLLNCVGGLERPTGGKINCLGADMLSISPRELGLLQRKKMGFVFQQANLFSYLSVFDNIAFPLSLNGAGKREKKRRVEELLDKIGLSGAARAMPHELSGGEAQRVCAARALAHAPSLLLADEPTASLDTATGKALIELIFGMGRELGCTVVVSTHDPVIIGLAGKTLRLSDGREAGP